MVTWQLWASSSAVLGLVFYLTWHFFTYGSNKGFTILPFVGIFPQLLWHSSDLYEYITDLIAKSPNMVIFGAIPGLKWLFTANPQHIQHLLKDNFDNYPKGEDFLEINRDLFGRGIINSDGESWYQQRKVASHEFSMSSLRKMMLFSFHFEIQQRLLPTLDNFAALGQPVDMQDVFLRFTFDTICRSGFGVDLGCLSKDFPDIPCAKSLDRASGHTVFRSLVPSFLWKTLRFLRLGPEREVAEDMSIINDFVADIIRSRREDVAFRKGSGEIVEEGALGDRVDLLSRMMALGERDHGRLFDDTFLRDACMNFLIAGRDTTAVALTWFFWLLTQHPEVEQKVVAELEGIASRRSGVGAEARDAPFSYEELKEMHYTHAAVSEALRLYPPVPIDFKECRNDDTFPDGTPVGKGWRVSYIIYAVGRMTAVWGLDAKEFKPQRWLTPDGEVKTESPFKFPVFNAGPRLCLGREMAFMQIKAVAGSILRKYHLEHCPGHTISYEPAITFVMKTGLPMIVHPR